MRQISSGADNKDFAASAAELNVQRILDTFTPFSIEPAFGILPANGNIAFNLAFMPAVVNFIW